MNARTSGRRDGAIIVLAMVLLVAIGFLGAGLLRLTSATSLETSTWISDAQAFWCAEAGLEDAKARAWQNRTLWRKAEAFPANEPRTWTGSTARGSFRVTVSNVVGAAAPAYIIHSTGRSHGGALAAVELRVDQAAALSVGIFGEDSLQLQPGIDLYSYDSSLGHPPATSSGEASIGSNEEVDLQPGITLDGVVILGESTNGTPGEVTGGVSPSNIVVHSGSIDLDPLGIIGGALGDEFDVATTLNNNGLVSAIVNDRLSIRSGRTVTLPAGTYYLRELTIKGALNITGPVTIFLSGALSASPGSTINASLPPHDFRIFSRSTASIDLQPNGSFAGLLYAPYATEIKIRPGGSFYGAIWGTNVRLQPGEDIWIDTALLSYGAFNVYRLESSLWREIAMSW